MSAPRPTPPRDEPTLDEWMAYFEGRLLPAEAERLRDRMRAEPAVLARGLEVAGWIGADPQLLRPGPERPDHAAAPRPVPSGRARRVLFAAAALVLVAGVAVGAFLLSGLAGPSHPVSERFANATQVGVVGLDGGALRGDTTAATDPSTRATLTLERPDTRLVLAAAVPEPAHALFLLCGRADGSVRVLFDGRVGHGAADPLGGSAAGPEPLLVDEATLAQAPELVLLVGTRSFDARRVVDRVRAALLESADAAALQRQVAESFGCVVRVHPLRLAGAAEGARRRTGAVEVDPALRDALRALREGLDAGRFEAVAAQAEGLLAAHDCVDLAVEELVGLGTWELHETWHLRAAARRALDEPGHAADLVAARRELAALRARFVALVVDPARSAEAVAALRAACRSLDGALRRLLPPTDPARLRALHLEAKVALQLEGDADAAVAMLQDVRRGFDAMGATDHVAYASLLNDLAGVCRLLGHRERALHHARAAAAAAVRSRADARIQAEALRQVADLLLDAGEDVAAAEALRDAGAVLAASSAAAPGEQAVDEVAAAERRVHLALSRARQRLAAGDHDAAGSELLAAESVARRVGIHRYDALLALRYAELALASGEPDAAASWLDAARRDADAERRADPRATIGELQLAARIAAARGAAESALLLRIEAFELADGWLALGGGEDLGDHASRAAGVGLQALAGDLAAAWLQAGQTDRAFEVIERARAHALLEVLAGSAPAAAERERAAEFARQRADLHFELEVLAARGRAGERLEDRVEQVRAALADLLQREWIAARSAASRLRKELPELAPVAFTEVQELLPDDVALCYFARTADARVLFWLPPRTGNTADGAATLQALRLPAAATDPELIDTLRRGLRGLPVDAAAFADARRRLGAAWLPAPILAAARGARQLLLVPDHELAELPLEVLFADGEVDSRPLLDVLPPTTRLRALAMLRGRGTAPRGHPDRALLVGDPVYRVSQHAHTEAFALARTDDPSVGLPRVLAELPETGSELGLVQALCESAGVAVECLTGADALPTRVLADWPLGGILHLAAHGRVGDPWRPYSAGIQLSALPGDPDNGLLDIDDLLRHAAGGAISAPALVVLSACDTGLGAPGSFAGFSLPGAWHRLGTPSVVASLWAIDSATTVHLMQAFYRELLGGGAGGAVSSAAALHAARQQLRRLVDDPRLWGAFVHFGPP